MKEKRIYLLEDDPDIREIIRYILAKYGYTIFAFERVQDFKKQLESGVPDLFIMDINLPDGNGLELSKQLTAQETIKAPVILMSADVVNEKKALDVGAKNFISKPFRVDELLNKVQDLLVA